LIFLHGLDSVQSLAAVSDRRLAAVIDVLQTSSTTHHRRRLGVPATFMAFIGSIGTIAQLGFSVWDNEITAEEVLYVCCAAFLFCLGCSTSCVAVLAKAILQLKSDKTKNNGNRNGDAASCSESESN
jgi:hypothetical protein